MASQFASGRNAIAECDRCGFQYKLRTLRVEYVKGRDTNVKVCKACWDGDHPQLQLGRYPVVDAQAVRDPRPDFSGYAQSRAIINPVTEVVGSGFLGYASVTTT